MTSRPTRSLLSNDLTSLKGVGPALAKKLEKLGLHIVEDLLFLLPLRYEDRTQLVRIGALEAGQRCLVSGEILLAEVAYRGRRNLLVRISDGSGQLTLRFFHFSRQQQAQFQAGMHVTCFGEVRRGKGAFEMIHPEYRLLREGQDSATNDALTPIYPATEGVQQGRLRYLTDQALHAMQKEPPAELLPEAVTQKLGMPSLADAIRYLHRPPPDADVETLQNGTHACQQRLAFEELLAHYLSLRSLRALAETEDAIALDDGGEQVRGFIDGLPFRLTGAQQRVVDEILADLARAHPMMRLVQGDVGSGKTVVAAIACLKAIACGVQVAIMAPTEILAEQHWRNFCAWFQPLGIEPAWLSGSQKAAARRQALEAIADGGAQLVVGTHALFQEGVAFERLALVVIDEQHRFGVHQRMALRDKGVGAQGHPHQLVMTATPIPRTLAMAAYADLDTSVIDELPPGRQPVTTIAIPSTRRGEIVERVRAAVAEGQQAYWVCPLIGESDVLDYEAAEKSYAMLTEALPELRVGLIHGRMRQVEKDKGMQAFKEGLIQVLVATTVIEVGVDVPNASLMIVENAERMGLSQLHQLRGRVGRGAAQSHCVLLYKGPLGRIAKERLAVLRNTNDGFVVAQRDLELRGPGELLGTRQTGLPDYRVANLVRDAELMPQVQITAGEIGRSPAQAAAIVRRWLGDAGRYGKV
ncbi:MAG: ATP-dependent DNA helicase RecG [Gammaproteobacteria bacterium]|nr:ATP-dependent DNA helicase RecG [Gammaproteobacteria bacterium]MBT8094455.1 ATP-dependent DNA helicase RecG [Gammaproteobacteria bacterium]